MSDIEERLANVESDLALLREELGRRGFIAVPVTTSTIVIDPGKPVPTVPTRPAEPRPATFPSARQP